MFDYNAYAHAILVAERPSLVKRVPAEKRPVRIALHIECVDPDGSAKLITCRVTARVHGKLVVARGLKTRLIRSDRAPFIRADGSGYAAWPHHPHVRIRITR